MKSIKKKLSLLVAVALLFGVVNVPLSVSASELQREDVSTDDTMVEVVVLSDEDIMPASSGKNHFKIKLAEWSNSLI